MKEDYVNFEIAKLLKEKEFDVCTKSFYKKIDQLLHHNTCALAYFGNSTTLPAPTLQMAMKWLREVHNIFIQIELYSKNNDYCFELFQNTHRLMVEKREVYNSYESTCESAIKYCLTNLI